jgi:hypothetical protein
MDPTSQETETEDPAEQMVLEKIKAQKDRMSNMVKVLLYLHLLLPVLVILMMINPMSKVLLVPDIVSESVFTGLRLLVIVISCLVRCMTFREELQFQFHESYYLIYRIIQDKNVQLFKYIKLRI